LAGLAKLDPQKALGSQPSALSETHESLALSGQPRAGRPFDKLRAGRDSRQDADATFLAPHRPFKIIYATLYYDVRPSFVVDIGEQFEGKFASILAYKSQFSDQEAGKDLFPAHDEIRARVDAMALFYGMLGGVTYGEPFLQKEVGLVDDLLAIPVKSI
jgi:LmbE family N-acetylglucosaminyl deacetylase